MATTNGNYIQSGTLPLQLRKDIDKMFNSTMELTPDEVGVIFKTRPAPSGNRYIRAEIAGLGLPSEIPEGGTAPQDIPEEGFERQYFSHEYGLGYVVTEWMLEDELFGRIKQMPKALAESIKVFKNFDALDMLNNGENATEKYLAKDSLALFSTHTLLDNRFAASDTLVNTTGVSTPLSETSLDAAFSYFDNMVNENGFPMKMTPNKLIVAEGNRRVAHVLITQMYGGSVSQGTASLGYWGATAPTSGNTPGSTNLNLMNPKNGGVAAYNVFVSRYLENGRWFLQAPESDLFISYKRAPKQESWYDKSTHNTHYQVRTRYFIGAEEYRGIYGNPYST